jgi:hypothetical protein
VLNSQDCEFISSLKKGRRHWVGPGWCNAYEFGTPKDPEKEIGIPVALIQNDMMVSCPFTALTRANTINSEMILQS